MIFGIFLFPCFAAIGGSFSQNSSVVPKSEHDPVSGLVRSDTPKQFKLEIPIFGYKLDSYSGSLDWDEHGLLTLYQDSPNYVSIRLTVESGVFEYQRIPARGELYTDPSGDKTYNLDLEDIRTGFFMDLMMWPDITFVELGFDAGESQLCYSGLANAGSSMQDEIVAELRIAQSTNPPDLMSKYGVSSFTELVQLLRADVRDSTRVWTSPSRQLSCRSNAGTESLTDWITYTKYGIAHEQYDVPSTVLPEYLPDYYWEPYTEIDIGIYRRTPGEAWVKSDLQYYNKDYIRGRGSYVHDISAYAVYAGSDTQDLFKWQMEGGNWLEYQEVAALWYYYYSPGEEIDVHPWNTIVHATVCYGYGDQDSPSLPPHMAMSFVDYGAAAFVGATVEIPFDYNDAFTDDFWTALCQNDQSVYTATINYVNAHNSYYQNSTWTYGDHIKIYGNTGAVLAN